MATQWGPEEVVAHLRKVRDHFKLSDKTMDGFALVGYLERYDEEVESLTPEQAAMVTKYVIEGLKVLIARRQSAWVN